MSNPACKAAILCSFFDEMQFRDVVEYPVSCNRRTVLYTLASRLCEVRRSLSELAHHRRVDLLGFFPFFSKN